MTLSNDKVIRQINHTFVSGWENIKGKKAYGGSSNTHLPTYPAKEVNFITFEPPFSSPSDMSTNQREQPS